MNVLKKILTIIFISIFLFGKPVFCNELETSNEPSLSCESAFIFDNKTNQVLYSLNEDKKMFPASTTKILTAIVVIENCNLSDVVTARYDAISSIPEGYSTADIKIGEQFTVEQLLELLLIRSYNDAANILADYTGGSIDSFITMLNTKISDLGLSNTHFTNAYGLQDDLHYTTAKDLACIMKYCLKNDIFRAIAGRASCNIPATNVSMPRSLISTNELLLPDSPYYYKYLMTGKTGFTTQAKQCLVSSAYKDDVELVEVILGSENRFEDALRLYEYCYSNYSMRTVLPENGFVKSIDIKNAKYNMKSLNLLTENKIIALLPNSFSLDEIEPKITLNKLILAPIEKGDVIGTVAYTFDGIEYSSNLIAETSVEPTKFLYYFSIISMIVIFVGILFLMYYFLFLGKTKVNNNEL
ncbi:MAG: D-alanyl-D-alanine carboxypeptidase [Clostridia bacterium]|nr:D-alanyl-D-alanine carboxypeptidase [Clostridia bacterium]